MWRPARARRSKPHWRTTSTSAKSRTRCRPTRAGRRYAVAHQQGVKFLDEYHRLDVGFAFKKGTPLAKAFQAALNDLIENGTSARILGKWGTAGSARTSSRISPPELK